MTGKQATLCSQLLANWTHFPVEPETNDRCLPNYDGIGFCWQAANVGDTLRKECELPFCSGCNIEDRYATRMCGENGAWQESDYSACYRLIHNVSGCVHQSCEPCYDSFVHAVQMTTLSLSIVSSLLLLFSLAIFCYYKSLQNTRLSIHKHLACALILRFLTYILWILLWLPPSIFNDCVPHVNSERIEWACKSMLFFIMFSTVASVYWMCVEGIYLASRLSIFTFSAEASMTPFYFIGWGLPLLVVLIWAVLMDKDPKANYCWIPYSTSGRRWVLVIPMLVVLMISFALLILIVTILVRKLYANHTTETQKLWKAIKAALVLIPLLGITNLLFFVEPTDRLGVAFNVYIMFNAVMQSSQGIFLSIVYCFLSQEIRQCMLRTLQGSCIGSLLSKRQNGSKHRYVSYATATAVSHETLDLMAPGIELQENTNKARGIAM